MRIGADRLSIGLPHTEPMVPAQPPQNGAPRSASKGRRSAIGGEARLEIERARRNLGRET
jgi:hypothetical protein